MDNFINALASPKSDNMSIDSAYTPERPPSDCSTDLDDTILSSSITSETTTPSVEDIAWLRRSSTNTKKTIIPETLTDVLSDLRHPALTSTTSSDALLSIAVPVSLSDIAEQHGAIDVTVSGPLPTVASMSGQYYYNPNAEDEDEQDYATPYRINYASYNTSAPSNVTSGYTVSPQATQRPAPQQRYSVDPQQMLQSQYGYTTAGAAMQPAPVAWNSSSSYAQQPPVQIAMYGSSGIPTTQHASYFPSYVDPMSAAPVMSYQQYLPTIPAASYLSPPPAVAGPSRSRPQRATSIASSVSYNTDNSRSASPNALEMSKWGTRLSDGTWKCSYQGCTSSSVFSRGCDLRKHYKRHTKTLFCRYADCPQSSRGGFSSKKDRARHEAKHDPNIHCEFEGCEKIFSRVDNMKDHVKRVHRKRAGGS